MADNRKYYYLKLKENFFDSDSIVLLEDMKDGILYSNILLKLYLKSLKNGGKLQLDEHIPYTAQMIATLTRHQIGTVERALEIFRQLGLVEQLDSGAFYMTDIELMIGQSSTEAERKRAARLENKALLPPRTKGGHLSDIRPPEIELEKEIEIEKEREGETGPPTPAAYGRYNNVILTDTELSGLKTELPDKWEYYIDRLSCHIASTGKQYHSHAATIYKWAQEDAAKGKAAPKQGIPDYSCKEEKKGIFILVKTSNPSSGEFQDRMIDGRPLYEWVGEKVAEWGADCMGDSYSYVGAVVGATYPEQGKILRKVMPKSFILVPGYGAQGGKGADLVHFFNEDGLGAIVNSSRGIICAYKQDKYKDMGITAENFADASRKAVEDMIEDISGALANR